VQGGDDLLRIVLDPPGLRPPSRYRDFGRRHDLALPVEQQRLAGVAALVEHEVKRIVRHELR
jgi:hypothetical protein